jgi:hypothetical protein
MRYLVRLAMALTLCCGAVGPVTANAEDWSYGEGSFETFKSDRGRVDSKITWWVEYKWNGSTSFYINRIGLTDPGGHDYHMWNETCAEGIDCKHVCHATATDTFDTVEPGWRISNRPTVRISATVTNEPDCTGISGETWRGYITLPQFGPRAPR